MRTLNTLLFLLFKQLSLITHQRPNRHSTVKTTDRFDLSAVMMRYLVHVIPHQVVVHVDVILKNTLTISTFVS